LRHELSGQPNSFIYYIYILYIYILYIILKKIYLFAGSDCSSEVSSVCTSMPSISQIGNNGNKLPDNKKTINSHLNIDTRQLYDPDSLWRRNKYRYLIEFNIVHSY